MFYTLTYLTLFQSVQVSGVQEFCEIHMAHFGTQKPQSDSFLCSTEDTTSFSVWAVHRI